MPILLERTVAAAPARWQPARTLARPAVRQTLCILGWILLAVIAWRSIAAGLHLRQWAWDQSQPWRFEGDIRNAYEKGTMALDPKNGYLNLYTRFRQQPHPGSSFNLDYAPLRLLIMTKWVAWTRVKFPETHGWQRTYQFNAPLLTLNTTFELEGFAGMWLLVGYWVRRSSTPPPRRIADRADGSWYEQWVRFWTTPGILLAAAAGLIAAELFWFNAAVIWDSHVWPQWDVWPLPFYIFAILVASLDAWWTAGLLLSAGALLKGQVLMIAPVMILWPLFAGKPWSACRIAVGLAFGLLAYASPWLLRTSDLQVWHLSHFSLAWVASAVLAAALVRLRFKNPRYGLALRGVAALLAAALLAWPFILEKSTANFWALAAIALIYALVAAVPRRYAPGWGFWLATATVLALALCPWFGGNMDWWNVGFERGTVQYMHMHMGSTLNLAAILDRFGWHSPKEDAWMFRGQMYPLRTVLIAVYCLGLIACAIGAAIHYRRRDSRVLIALVTPWILMYATLAQIHDRYLVYAAGLTAVAVAVGVGMTLVHLIITAIAWASVLMSVNVSANPPWLKTALHAIYPDAAWLTLMCAAIFLWISIAPRRRRRFPSSV